MGQLHSLSIYLATQSFPMRYFWPITSAPNDKLISRSAINQAGTRPLRPKPPAGHAIGAVEVWCHFLP